MMCTDKTPQPVSGSNQIIYQRLKQALTIDLRRQIFIAVCDDLCLRDCLAAHLQSELLKGDFLLSTGRKITSHVPSLVTLSLDANDPHPLKKIHHWFSQNPLSEDFIQSGQVIKFQMVGIEQLTRQPAFVQWSFLSNLREIEQYFHQLDFSLLLWVSQPWLYSIQQSAPEFWCWYTGVFHFEGEPTPTFFTDSSFLEVKEFLPLLPQTDLTPSSQTSEEYYTPQNGHEFNQINGNSQEGANPPFDDISNSQTPKDITSFLDLLDDFDFDKFIKLVKLTPVNLDHSHAELTTGEEVNPLELVEFLGFLRQQNPETQMIIAAYFQLGKFYQEEITISQEPSSIQLERLILAICCYQQIYGILSQEKKQTELVYPDYLEDLAKLYRVLTRLPEGQNQISHYLEKSIFYEKQAIYYINSKEFDRVVKIHQNIGICYGELARYQTPVENWQKAILSYQEALLYLHPEQDPSFSMTLENNRGTAYWNLAQYAQPVTHLKNAIAAYHKALLFCDQEKEPISYGGIQNNLGTAYWNLAQHQPSRTLLIKAIDAYREALKYRTSASFPLAYANTQNNLGTAYWHLANQSQSYQGSYECLQKSIKAYKEALKITQQFAPNQFSFDQQATHNNTGLAYYQLGTHPTQNLPENLRISHLQSALFHQIQAYLGKQKQLQILSETSAPFADETTLNGIVKTLRAFYTQGGLTAQNFALSQIPGDLLPQILSRL